MLLKVGESLLLPTPNCNNLSNIQYIYLTFCNKGNIMEMNNVAICNV